LLPTGLGPKGKQHAMHETIILETGHEPNIFNT